MNKKCYLHIGIGKTGSTTIQSVLAKNRKYLKDSGYLFPKTPDRGHAKFAQIGWSDEEMILRPYYRKQSEYKTPGQLREGFMSDFREEVRSDNSPNVIISNETLHLLPEDNFDWLLNFLRELFSEVVVIIFVRRQDEFLVSYYKQGLISGLRKTVDDYINDIIEGQNQSIFTPKLDYAELLETLSGKSGITSLHPILYHKKNFIEKGLLQQFLEACDLQDAGDLGVNHTTANKSLDAVCAEFLRRHNSRRPGEIPPSALVEYLKTQSAGPDIQLSSSLKQRISDKYEASNRRLAKKYLGSSGQLLMNTVASPTPKMQLDDMENSLERLGYRVEEWLKLNKVSVIPPDLQDQELGGL
ncbi:hypothetical protein ACSSVY_004054 [Roseovarius sp. MBR-51]